jgi:hypothetical protein
MLDTHETNRLPLFHLLEIRRGHTDRQTDSKVITYASFHFFKIRNVGQEGGTGIAQ